ncbi:MAG: hypothetical protein RSE41_08735 [Clostridia bacterium]
MGIDRMLWRSTGNNVINLVAFKVSVIKFRLILNTIFSINGYVKSSVL